METKALNCCVVCKETSEQVALHYTRMLCNGCRAFFKRTVQGKVKIFSCKSDGQCVVDLSTRKLCKACRFEACKRAGVDSTKVQHPKEDNTEVNTQDHQFGHAINVNGHLMPSTSCSIQSAFQPYYFTAQASQASQNICAIPPAISFYTPSPGIGLYNQNLAANFSSHPAASPHIFTSSQPPIHCSNSASSSSMQIWPSPLSGAFLPAGYSSVESNNRLAASSSMNVPYGSSLDTAGSSKFASHADVANYISTMGSSLFYNPNAASTSQNGALSYADLFQQSASTLANYASVPGIHALASSWIDRYGLNGNTVPISVHDSALPSQTDSYSISNTRNNMIRSLMSTVPFPTEAQIQDSKYDIVGMYQRDRCNTQTPSVRVKREFDYPNDSSQDSTDNQQDASDTLDQTTIGHQLQVGKDLKKSPVQQEMQQLSLGANYLLAGPSKYSKEVPSVSSSGKSSAFMIDTLLKPQHKMLSTEDEIASIASRQYNAWPLTLNMWQDDKNAHETIKSQSKNDFREKTYAVTCKDVDIYEADAVLSGGDRSLYPDIYADSNSVNNDETGLMESSDSNDAEGESSLDGTLEYVDVHTIDEDIQPNDFKHVNTAEVFYQRNINPDSVEATSKGGNEDLAKNACCSDSECITKNTMSQQINSSLGLHQSHGVSNGDSGLGRSNHASSSELQQNRPASVDKVKATGTEHVEVRHINKENAQVTLPRSKRRLSLSEESNICSTKKIKLNNHSFTATPCNRTFLVDISQNYDNKINNHENSPRKLSAPMARNSDSSSEDEATTRKANLRPQYTSTPIVHAKVNKSRFFLDVICDFAKYCQVEDTNTHEEENFTSGKHSRSHSPPKHPSSPACVSQDSFDQQDSSESNSKRLERLERFQAIIMGKVRSSSTYTMAEFKADALKLNSFAQDAVRGEHLQF